MNSKSRLNSYKLCALGVLAFGVASTLWARDVSVVSHDTSTDTIQVTVSAGEAGCGEKPLYVVFMDRAEEDVTALKAATLVATVPEAGGTFDWTCPAKWRATTGCVRFYLMEKKPVYQNLLKSLRSVSAGPYIDTEYVPNIKSDISVTMKYPKDVAFGVSEVCYLFSNMEDNAAEQTYFYGFMGYPSTLLTAK